MRPYDSYKRSGVPWLTEIPEHWELKRLKFVAKTIAGQSPPSEIVSEFTGRYPFLQGNAEFGPISPNPKLSCETPNKFAEQGDILLSVRAPVGAINIADQRYGIGRGLCAIRAEGTISRKFLHHSLTATKETLREASTGSTYDAVSVGDVGNIATPIPSSDEQTAIVRFLDHADEQIQRYIAAKERLIKLLEEQRQALVHQAVTQGLDPNVRLKPSGVEWMGEVPEHWEVVPFKRRVGFREGPGIMAADFRESGVPLLRISCLCGPVATLDGCNYLDPDVVRARWSHFAIKEGDYLLSASASTGVVSLATSKVAGCVPYTGIIRLWSASPRTVMPYVRLFLSSRLFLDQVDLEKTGVAISHFGPTHLSRMVITLPPEPEQQAIVEYIDKATAGIDAAIARSHRQINLMNEYRTRLSADVVTGQLDVRKAAAALPAAP